MKLILFFSIFFYFQAWAVNDLALSDISIIMPPTKDVKLIDQMIKANEVGPRGSVLLKSLYDQMDSPEVISPLHEDGDLTIDNEELYNRYLKVVSIRIDPCFVFEAGPFKCEHQIRYVFQPIINTDTTLDIAIHTFYNLTELEFSQLISKLVALKSRYKFDTAQVNLPSLQNPVLYQQGLGGDYWKELKQILLSYTGEDNFVRLNTMANALDRVWVFRGFKFVNSKLVDNIIPFVKVEPDENFSIQMFRKLSFDNTYKSLLFTPYEIGTESEQAMQLFLDQKKSATYTEDQLKNIFATVVKDQNPLLTDTTNVDCLRCHVGNMLSKWGKANVNYSWNWKLDFSSYPAPENIASLPNEIDVAAIRMFGYWKKSELISQRVINESVESLKLIKQQYAPK